MTKNAFYFTLKALFSLRYLNVCPKCLNNVGKLLDKGVKVNLKIYDVKNWERNNYNIHIFNISISQYFNISIFQYFHISISHEVKAMR